MTLLKNIFFLILLIILLHSHHNFLALHEKLKVSMHQFSLLLKLMHIYLLFSISYQE